MFQCENFPCNGANQSSNETNSPLFRLSLFSPAGRDGREAPVRAEEWEWARMELAGTAPWPVPPRGSGRALREVAEIQLEGRAPASAKFTKMNPSQSAMFTRCNG